MSYQYSIYMRLSLFCPADVAPLAVPNNDTAPLHTPTLPPMSPHLVPAPPSAGAAPAPPSETERPPHCSGSHAASSAPHQRFPYATPKTRDIHQFSTSFAAAVPHDWFSNPDSLKESFRIASNLDWANIDLSGYPGQLCESPHAKMESSPFLGFHFWV